MAGPKGDPGRIVSTVQYIKNSFIWNSIKRFSLNIINMNKYYIIILRVVLFMSCVCLQGVKGVRGSSGPKGERGVRGDPVSPLRELHFYKKNKNNSG